MADKKKHPWLRQLTEGLLAIGLVLGFFFIIILVLNTLFPDGGLQLFAPKGLVEGNATSSFLPGQRSIALARDGDNAGLGDGDWAATLVAIKNQVKSKRAVDIAWHSAKKGMMLYSLDAVQTLDDSTARIRFDSRNEIDLGANSLIVIRRLEQDLLFKEKRSFMVVVDGELRGRLSGENEGDVYLEVTTPNAVTRLQTQQAGEEPLEFSIRVDDEDQSIVTLFSGEAEVEAGGEIVRLEANQATRVEGDAAPSVPVELPKPAVLKTPVAGAVFFYRDLPPRIRFQWASPPTATHFRLQVAKDVDFHNLIIDEQLTEKRFTHGNLAPGAYFWRVSAADAGGEGVFSSTRRLRLIEDRVPPELSVDPLPERISADKIEIRGHSEKGARIYIGEKDVQAADDGSFSYLLPLQPGANVIVVEAADAAGNISYSSHMLTAQISE